MEPIKNDVRHDIKHDHGRMFRAKIVPFTGPTEYGEWFGTESEVRAAFKSARDIGKKYYCETIAISCPECATDEKPHVVGML